MLPIVPIPSFYNEDESLNFQELRRYLEYLQTNGVETIMTTAGTSQYNLLANPEIASFNKVCNHCFSKQVILGITPTSLSTIKILIEGTPPCYGILVLYPDRLYDSGDEIYNYFSEVAKFSHSPIWLHAMPVRSGHGLKWVDFPIEVIKRLSKLSNIAGIKEESRHYETAYEVSRLATDNFSVCVAGGSGRRFSLCRNAGATTYLAGLGNLFPFLENSLQEAHETWLYPNGDGQLKKLVNIENKFFDVMKPWHPSLREAINILGFEIGNRKPFPTCSPAQYKRIESLIRSMKNE